jgi:hypothetical protein
MLHVPSSFESGWLSGRLGFARSTLGYPPDDIAYYVSGPHWARNPRTAERSDGLLRKTKRSQSRRGLPSQRVDNARRGIGLGLLRQESGYLPENVRKAGRSPAEALDMPATAVANMRRFYRERYLFERVELRLTTPRSQMSADCPPSSARCRARSSLRPYGASKK